MPTPPYAQVLVSRNGAAASSGVVQVFAGDVIQFQMQSTVGVRTQRWEIFDYPVGWTSVPTGWSQDPSGSWVSTDIIPQPITIPAQSSNAWGKAAVRLRINGNPLQFNTAWALNPGFNPALTDESCQLDYRSVAGLEGFCVGDVGQVDPFRKWAGTLMRFMRGLVSANTPTGIGGGANALPADAISLSLPSAGTAVLVPLAHAFTTTQNTQLSGGNSVQVTVAGPVCARARVCFTAPAGPTKCYVAIYQNGVQIADSVTPVQVAAGEFITLFAETLVTAAANDVFSVQAYTSGAAGATTFAVSNAALVLSSPYGQRGNPGPPGPSGSGGIGATGTPLTGSSNPIPVGNTSNCINCTTANVAVQIASGANDGETKNFVISGGNGTYNLNITSSGGPIVSVTNAGVGTGNFQVNGVAGTTVTLNWVAAVGSWFTA